MLLFVNMVNLQQVFEPKDLAHASDSENEVRMLLLLLHQKSRQPRSNGSRLVQQRVVSRQLKT